MNDLAVGSYKVYDIDARWSFKPFGMSSYIQLNLTNVFDEEYLGNISSRTEAVNNPRFTVGAPRTLQVTFETQF